MAEQIARDLRSGMAATDSSEVIHQRALLEAVMLADDMGVGPHPSRLGEAPGRMFESQPASVEVVAADRDHIFRIAAVAERRMVIAADPRLPARIATVGRAGVGRAVAGTGQARHVDIADLAQHRRAVMDAARDNVDYLAFTLNDAGDADHRR